MYSYFLTRVRVQLQPCSWKLRSCFVSGETIEFWRIVPVSLKDTFNKRKSRIQYDWYKLYILTYIWWVYSMYLLSMFHLHCSLRCFEYSWWAKQTTQKQTLMVIQNEKNSSISRASERYILLSSCWNLMQKDYYRTLSISSTFQWLDIFTCAPSVYILNKLEWKSYHDTFKIIWYKKGKNLRHTVYFYFDHCSWRDTSKIISFLFISLI